MAHLQLPIVPRRLYRYRALTRRENAVEQEICSIRDRFIYCSDFSRMNDPMEGFYVSSAELRSDPIYREAVQKIKYRKLDFGLACFSETHENVLMWAHYADNYSGICIEYSSVDLIAGLPREASIVRMAYVDDVPEISPTEATNEGDAAAYILSQKKSNWAYEREWRVLAHKEEVTVGLKQPVTAIYLGVHISNEHRHRILTRLNGTGIKAYKMEVSGYKHVFSPINDPARTSGNSRRNSKIKPSSSKGR
jgi:hypothetical protein